MISDGKSKRARLETEFFVYEGEIRESEMEGKGRMKFNDGSYIEGEFLAGDLHGEGKYYHADGRVVIGKYVHGSLQGLVREIDGDGKDIFVGYYQDSQRCGHGKLVTECGTYIGEFKEGEFHGKNNRFLYPPISGEPPGYISLVGEWDKGRMISAKAFRAHKIGESGSPVGEFEYKEDVSTSQRISCHPLVKDIFEDSLVEVRPSNIGPNAGEGLFAKVDLPSDTIVAYYNGIRLTHATVDARDWKQNSNTITLSEESPKASNNLPKTPPTENPGISKAFPSKSPSKLSKNLSDSTSSGKTENPGIHPGIPNENPGKRSGIPAAGNPRGSEGISENLKGKDLSDGESEGEEGSSGEDCEEGIVLDVPGILGSTNYYIASLGHKVNHTFDPAKRNSVYAHCQHPRFGHIKSVKTTRKVAKDEELLVNYGYDIHNVTGDGVPAWFESAHSEFKRTRVTRVPTPTDTKKRKIDSVL